MKTYLNKTDYQRFSTCPAAAWHSWQRCESKNDDDPFLSFLAEEGKTVGRAAKRLFHDGLEIEEQGHALAFAATKRALFDHTGAIFEGCAVAGKFLARPDVLIRDGQRIFLIEVKSKVGDMAKHLDGQMLLTYYGDIRSAWKEYVRDLAFQAVVLKRAFPDFEILPYLLLPEGSAHASAEEVDAVRACDFSASGLNDDEMRRRRANSVLKFFPAKKAIEKVYEETERAMAEMEEAWLSQSRPSAPLKYQCRNCEFRLKDGRELEDGFNACWGKLAEPAPHLFDLYNLYSLKTDGRNLLADQKIDEGTTSLYDVREDELHGEHANRQRMQLTYQRSGKEWIAPELELAIKSLSWPICFLDFETSMAAIPWYVGVKPYEIMPFQFSAHILNQDGTWRHVEWLNLEDKPPTLQFVRQLMSALEGIGSILVYTDYENRVLSDSIKFLMQQDYDTNEEREWLSKLLYSGRIVDQHKWVYNWHFEASMGGKTSIKKVLPSVWNSNSRLHQHPYFKRYFEKQEDLVLNPYKTLPSKKVAGLDWEVREGCAAMTTYRELIRGVGAKDPEAKAGLGSMLTEYVTLDTASQWMIFEHWRQHFGL